MNRLDKSLEEFDLIKLLIFLLLFLAMSLFMVLAFIVPNIKEHKREKASYGYELVTTGRVETVLQEKESQLQALRVENRKVIEAFVSRFDEERFVRFVSEFFEEVSLARLEQKEHEEDFVMYELKVTSLLKTPSKFYEFLESLKRYEGIVKADFPIEMRAEGGLIHATFNIKVFELKR
ncbi:hypothetical protein JWV37_07800 [Sulfurospirillum sp. T05]|uniref:Uncharacterized protein n=1 Tax=Sulfurospirillum tamanense TaxID=2813362 RepID=A0ABS2WT37_9BACT|nr:hypothetical protein [Sulfurospirillum tamanensis]MBN2964680.1 hypothetical protein [Sulfurospirillum tamanensis]